MVANDPADVTARGDDADMEHLADGIKEIAAAWLMLIRHVHLGKGEPNIAFGRPNAVR
jgi:hypothetical protein